MQMRALPAAAVCITVFVRLVLIVAICFIAYSFLALTAGALEASE
jgi:hypothetical protein